MGFAMFNVFFFLTGALILQLLRLSGVHMDLVSFCFLLFNFSVSAAVELQVFMRGSWFVTTFACCIIKVFCSSLGDLAGLPGQFQLSLENAAVSAGLGMRPDAFHLVVAGCLLPCLQVVGILSLFFLPVPLFLKQCYTVWVGICVAYIFTHVPEWTSWVLLVIMALYDLAAVLLPGGPLKVGGKHLQAYNFDEARTQPEIYT